MTTAARYDVIIDLASVDFLDSSGLNALIAIRNHASRHGGSVRLINPSRQTVRVIEMTGLTSALPLVAATDQLISD